MYLFDDSISWCLVCPCGKHIISQHALCWQVFWMLGSMLIIVLGMLIVPTLGWRWMIRISVTPSIILIFLFKVGKLISVSPLKSKTSRLCFFLLVYPRVGTLQCVRRKHSSCCQHNAKDCKDEQSIPPSRATSGTRCSAYDFESCEFKEWVWNWLRYLFSDREGKLEDSAQPSV